MRFQLILSALALCMISSQAVVPAVAAAVTTEEAATQRAKAEGYSLVSKAEATGGTWDVWASRDGIAYEVKIDARDGSVLNATPIEDND